ncbi:site-specific integrase [Sphingomonas sp. RHCKR47]|uniref:site-specific integrase n=1 Tax=Sphingomonas citricola TaxID=2862498 RepID=UPI001C666E6D|nr:site-specific integrase [Sphingomonas citricola]MBW6523268.1 site-specific integrase [Sphingomonas citricola]
MATQKLGRRLLATIGPVTKPCIIYDSDLKGFGIKLLPPSGKNPEGAKSWIVEYRPGAGGRGVAKRRVVLGAVGSLTPEQARDAAKTMLASVRLGADPSAARAEKRSAKTIAELASLYSAETDPVRKARTVQTYATYWNNHLLPALGSTIASAITKADLVRLHRSIGAEKQVTANRLLTLLAHFFSWAQDGGHVPKGFNPASAIERFKEAGKERFLTADELGRLGAALRLAETAGIPWAPTDLSNPNAKHATKQPEKRVTKISPQSAGAIRLLLFTGARLREVLHLEWKHVDLSRGMLFLPDSKTGKKVIVLGAPAIAILQSLHDLAVEDARPAKPGVTKPLSAYVFPTEDLKRPKHDLNKPWRLIVRGADLQGLRLHDLRHSYASIGAAASLGLPIIGKLLGHRATKTTERYAHLDADPLRRATDIICTSITAAMEGTPA